MIEQLGQELNTRLDDEVASHPSVSREQLRGGQLPPALQNPMALKAGMDENRNIIRDKIRRERVKVVIDLVLPGTNLRKGRRIIDAGAKAYTELRDAYEQLCRSWLSWIQEQQVTNEQLEDREQEYGHVEMDDLNPEHLLAPSRNKFLEYQRQNPYVEDRADHFSTDFLSSSPLKNIRVGGERVVRDVPETRSPGRETESRQCDELQLEIIEYESNHGNRAHGTSG